MSALPDYIYEMGELPPVEDVLLSVLRPHFPSGIHLTTRIPPEPRDFMFPMILARANPGGLGTPGDPRFTGRALVAIHTFTQDSTNPFAPDGDDQGAALSEAVRVVMRDTGWAKPILPGLGSVLAITMTSPPRRVTDWSTATGPVQYADLPADVWRYETHYRVAYRRPLN